MVFSTVLKGADADPCAEILRKRATTLRRMLVKHLEERARVDRVVWMHLTAKREGTFQGEPELANATPAPPPSAAGRAAYKSEQHQTGPISLLLDSLYQAGMRLDEHLQIWAPGEPPFHIMRAPWNHLQEEV